jgi:dihydroorotase
MPIAKHPFNRDALLAAATSDDPKFFLGTEPAPHPRSAKARTPNGMNAVGVCTQPFAVQYIAPAFDQIRKLDKVRGL